MYVTSIVNTESYLYNIKDHCYTTNFYQFKEIPHLVISFHSNVVLTTYICAIL